jgi:hypothetical protein
MEIGGFNKEPDWVRLGPSLLIASCLILAIRTAKWEAHSSGTQSHRDLDVEVDYAIFLASTVLSTLLRRKSNLFQQKDVPWYQPSEDESTK